MQKTAYIQRHQRHELSIFLLQHTNFKQFFKINNNIILKKWKMKKEVTLIHRAQFVITRESVIQYRLKWMIQKVA